MTVDWQTIADAFGLGGMYALTGLYGGGVFDRLGIDNLHSVAEVGLQSPA